MRRATVLSDLSKTLRSRRLNLRQLLLILAILVFSLAAWIRIASVNNQGLWADEFFSLAMATGHSLEHPAHEANPALGDYVESPKPESAAVYQRYLRHEDPPAGLSRVLRAVLISDSNPPLYYLLLNLWTQGWGTRGAALHGFSVFWALSSFPLLWSIGRYLGGRTTALMACMLFGAAPASLHYSTEGRMYALLWFLTLSLIWSTLELARRGYKLSLFVYWISASAAGFLTHYFFSFVWMAAFIWLLFSPGNLKRVVIGLGSAIILLIIFPWYAQLPQSLSRWRITGDWLAGFPLWNQVLVAPLSLMGSFVSGNGPWGGGVWGKRLGLLFLIFILLAVKVWSCRMTRISISTRRLVYLWLIAACLGPLALDGMRNTASMLISRYALAGMPALFLLAGLGLSKFRLSLRVIMLAIILLIWWPSARAAASHYSRWGQPYRELGLSLSADRHPSDLIIVGSIPSAVIGIAHYLAPDTDIVSWVRQLEQRRIPEDIETLITGRRRIVFIKIHYDIDDRTELESWLYENTNFIKEVRKEHARLIYFSPRPRDRPPAQ